MGVCLDAQWLTIAARRIVNRYPQRMGKDVRIGDAERDEAVGLLQEHHIAGRLSVEEMDERVTAALSASKQSDIARLLSDLPSLKSEPERRSSRRAFVILPVIAIAIGAGAFALRDEYGSTESEPSNARNPSVSSPSSLSSAPEENIPPAPSADDQEVPPPTVQVVDYGFGQMGDESQAIVIVRNDSASAVGEFLTASVNFLDINGGIVGTETQVEAFSWVGQELALPIWLYSEGGSVSVSEVDPSISISDYGSIFSARTPLPVLETTNVSEAPYGGYTASFEYINETGADLRDLRIGVACYDAAGSIIGGASIFPPLAPAGKTIRIEAEYLVVSESPASCKAFLNYGDF